MFRFRSAVSSRRSSWFLSGCLLATAPAWAQTPTVVNGTFEARAATQALDREITAMMSRSPGPAWVGYAVPVNGRDRDIGCWTSDGITRRTRVEPLKLEGPDSLFVLYRIADRRVDRVRVASPECPLDAGGLTLYWLTGVRAMDSIAWLTTLASGEGARRVSNAAIMAIAMHDEPGAADRLIALARTGPNRDVRGNAIFWVAQRAGDKAVGTIMDSLDDPDSQIRTKAVFALSQLPKDEGIPKLIELARTHRDSTVRRRAMFWLGQSGDPRALEFFEQILRP
jgi:hypothetical protein